MSAAPSARKPRGKTMPAPAPLPRGLQRLNAIAAWRGWSATFILAALALVWALPQPEDLDVDEPFASVGYNEIIDEIFVPFGWLVRNEPASEGGVYRPIVTVAARARAFPEVSRFIRTSFLRGDIAADDANRWRFDGDRVVGVEPWAHAMTGPLAERGGWRGNMLYRQAGGGEVAIEGGPQRLVLEPATEHVPIDWQIGLNGEERTRGSARHGFEILDGSDRVASVQRIGRDVVIRTFPETRGRAIVVEPGGTSRAFRGAGSTVYRLTQGARLVLRPLGQAEGGISFRLAGGAVPAASSRPFGGRRFDPVAELIARPVSAVLDSIVRRNRSLSDLNVQLTLDASIQAEAQQILEEKGIELLGPHDRPFRAGVTVMDAMTGDLLALASFPTQTSQKLANVAAPDAWLVQNQNFIALPIGSVAKVPFAAAILTQHPDLASMVTDGSGDTAPGGGHPFRSVVGVTFDAINDTVGLAGITFEVFLQKSSNRYAATLMMLAAARGDPGAGDGYVLPAGDRIVLGGRALANAPRLVFPCQERLGNRCNRFGRVTEFGSYLSPGRTAEGAVRLRWPTAMERLLDMPGIQTSLDVPPHDTTIWAPLIATWGEEAQRSFSALSPETELFRLDRIDNIRNDYLSLILGGGRSRWTNVKLAEAYSRLVLDRRIVARLAIGATAEPVTQRSGFNPIALRALRAGMRAAQQSGTAAQIRPGFVAPPGQEIRIFAKTGTPSLAALEWSPLNEELNALIGRNIVGLRDGRLMTLGRPGEAEAAALARLRRDAEREDTPEVTAPLLLRRMRLINAERARGRAGGLTFDVDGRLAGVAPDRSDPLATRGGAVALTIGLYAAGTSDCQPLRALTIVVNIQARARQGRRLGDNPAVQVAQSLLAGNGPIGRWLLHGPVSPAGQRWACRS